MCLAAYTQLELEGEISLTCGFDSRTDIRPHARNGFRLEMEREAGSWPPLES